MEFKQFRNLMQENFKKVSEDATHLFEVDLDKDALYALYLDSFPAGTNPMYRTRREFDCSCCRRFIKNIGNAVILKDNKVTTIWDFDAKSSTFQPVIDAMDKFVKAHIVSDLWFTKFNKIGTDVNYEMVDGNKVAEWNHFFLNLPAKFVYRGDKSEGDFKGGYRDTRNVFKRSLDEITMDSLDTVLELIAQNSLYKGEEWKNALTEFRMLKKAYDKLKTDSEKATYAWEQSVKVGAVIGRIKNHSIGTLLMDISEDVDLLEAVRKYEAIVAPSNYKRPKTIYTKKMLEDAQKKLESLGYMDSLARRYAVLDDITVNNILFSNKDSAKRISGNVFDDMLKTLPVDAKKFSRVEEVSIDTFINNILPTATELELLLENKHNSNMMSLIAPINKDSKTMFKWDNNFSWAYSGNIADSMKERVKSAGGKVDGVLRFSIQWNDEGEHDTNDLDAHCIEPNKNRIYFSSKRNYATTGELDIDIQNPTRGEPAVENITWSNRAKMLEGKYEFLVHNYNNRGGRTGFRAEIEFDGQMYSFNYPKEVRQGEYISVADVMFNKATGFTIVEKLPSSTSSKNIWGVQTNQFVPVSVVMHSPNYWNLQEGIGNKHYFFMLRDCINPEMPNAFFNEYLNHELNENRKVMEALGGQLKVQDSDDQLSGVGFSSTQRNEVTIKVKGKIERVVKVKF